MKTIPCKICKCEIRPDNAKVVTATYISASYFDSEVKLYYCQKCAPAYDGFMQDSWTSPTYFKFIPAHKEEVNEDGTPLNILNLN